NKFIVFLRWTKSLFAVQFFSTYGKFIGRAPIYISLPIIINEQGRILKIVQYSGGSLPIPLFWIIGKKDAHGTRWVSRYIKEGVLIIKGGGCIRALKIPFFGTYKFPIVQIRGMPIPHRSGYEHIIFVPKTNHCGIGPGAIGDIFMGIIDHIGIIYIDGIAIGTLLCGSLVSDS